MKIKRPNYGKPKLSLLQNEGSGSANAEPQRQVYNPRRMRWEFEDGSPVEPKREEPSSGRKLLYAPFGPSKGRLLESLDIEDLEWLYLRTNIKELVSECERLIEEKRNHGL